MKISVAMTTYNGEHYIKSQLESLRLQTCKIDELIIFDDCSKDTTMTIVKNYIEEWALSNWKIYSSEKNCGWITNFYNAISKTTGDIVFFCDQDDVWDKEKIEIMCQIMEENSDIEVLACRLNLIDSRGNSIPDNSEKFPFNSEGSKKISKNIFDSKFLYTISPGCTLAVKRNYIELLNKYIIEKNIPHDALYWKIATLNNHAYIFDQALINYRIHETNASNPSVKGGYKVKNNEIRIKENEALGKMLKEIYEIFVSQKKYDKNTEKTLLEMIRFCDLRKQFLNREISLFRYYKQNIQYYRNKKMLLGDMLSRMKNKEN